MTEPATTAAGAFFGIKLGSVIAGAVGGIISLRYIDDLNMLGRVFAVVAGASMAGYGTPVMSGLLNLGEDTENALAFFLGLTAMNIIPGLIRLSEMFKSDPLAFIRRHTNKRSADHDL